METGEAIRRDPEFENSFSRKFELFLANRATNLTQLVPTIRAGEGLELEKSYVALAAPSMDEKTQFAFVCNEVKPLYFPFVGCSQAASQPIYRNFSKHSSVLLSCAKNDLEKFGRVVPSASDLQNIHSHVELSTLGFLHQLVQRVPQNEENWLQYFATQAEFSISNKSIIQVRLAFDGFALFLDEFTASPENAFILNLARALGIPTVVSNTTTKIANFAGPVGAGGGANPVWATIVTTLDPPSRIALDLPVVIVNATEADLTLSQALEKIIRLHPDGESGKVAEFLNDFIDFQLKNLRPGIAAFVVTILKDFARDPPVDYDFTLGALLDVTNWRQSLDSENLACTLLIHLQQLLLAKELFSFPRASSITPQLPLLRRN